MVWNQGNRQNEYIYIMGTAFKNNMTDAEYLSLEETALIRHELFHSNLIEMPGGTVYHETLVMNIGFWLRSILGEKSFKVFLSGLKLRISDSVYFYPDVLITNEVFKNPLFSSSPIFVAEVLSPGTRSFDTADKFLEYRNLPSLQYYLLAEPEYYHVTLHYKTNEGVWMSETYRKLADIIKLPLVGTELPLSEIYKGLEWD